MMKIALGLGRTGFQDWLLQRISAVILGSYFVFILFYIGCNTPLTFMLWQELFSCVWVKIFTFFALLSLVVHAWIGIWVVLTDYIKIVPLRLILQIVINICLITYLVWGIVILK